MAEIRAVCVWVASLLARVRTIALDSHRDSGWPSMAMAAVGATLLGSSFILGLSSGMDRTLAGPLDTRVLQIASALSDVTYELNMRYALHGRIADTLLAGGMSEVPVNYKSAGLSHPEYFTDAERWNQLLQKAATGSLSHNVSVMDGTLRFIQTEDLGLVDFYKLSFRLFGYKIQGFFYTYFLLLLVSVALLFAAFWTRPGVLLAANALLFGLFISVCAVSLPGTMSYPTVASGRFFGTLALFAALHLVLILWAPPPSSRLCIGLAVAQALFLGFVITMRSNVMWVVILVLLSVLTLVAWHARCSWKTVMLGEFARSMLTWPMISVVLACAAVPAYQRIIMHPGYTVLEETHPGHFFWHSLAYGLGLGDVESVMPEIAGERDDRLGSALGNAYLKQTTGFEHPNISMYYASNLFPGLGRPRAYERVVRSAFLDFALKHPGYLLRLTFITKPRLIARLFYQSSKEVFRRYWLLIAGAGLLLGIASRVVLRSASSLDDFKFTLLVTAGLLCGSLLPAFAAYPLMQSMGDAFAFFYALLASVSLIELARMRHRPATGGPFSRT